MTTAVARRAIFGVATLLFAVASAAEASEGLLPKFPISTFGYGGASPNTRPQIAVAPNGEFFAVWHSEGGPTTPTSPRSIQGRRFSALGVPLGDQFGVGTSAPESLEPAVAIDSDGVAFVVWWTVFDIEGRRIDAAGNPLGAQFSIADDEFIEFEPAVAISPTGEAWVVWTSEASDGSDPSGSIQARRYDASGNALTARFQVNTTTTGSQSQPHVSIAADGSVVVVWSDFTGDVVRGQRYAANGSAAGSEFTLAPGVNGWHQAQPVVHHTASGGFVVLWNGLRPSGLGLQLHGQALDSSANPVGAAFEIPPGNVADWDFAIDPADELVFVWSDVDVDDEFGGSTISGQRYDTSGAPLASRFTILDELGEHMSPSIGIAADAKLVIAWRSQLDMVARRSDSGILLPGLGPMALLGLALMTALAGGRALARR